MYIANRERCYNGEPQLFISEIPYEIEVHTGDVRGAGTNSNVFVALYGKEKKSEELWLRNKTDNFERAEIDKFKVSFTSFFFFFSLFLFGGEEGKPILI